jgi:Ca2+-binding EF-hand superfamily protein
MRTLVHHLSSKDATTVNVAYFCAELAQEYDFRPAQERNKDSGKLLMDRISLNLVNSVDSLSALTDATSEERLEKVASTLRIPLHECEIVGMPGMIDLDDFLREVAMLGLREESLGTSMRALMLLVDPQNRGVVDVDYFVDHVISHFDHMAWFMIEPQERKNFSTQNQSRVELPIEIGFLHQNMLEAPEVNDFSFKSRDNQLFEDPNAAQSSLARRLSMCLMSALVDRRGAQFGKNLSPVDMTRDQILPMVWDAFTEFDADDTGLIDLYEFNGVMKRLGVDGQTLGTSMSTLLSLVDNDGDGLIDYDEFLQFIMRHFDKSVWLLLEQEQQQELEVQQSNKSLKKNKIDHRHILTKRELIHQVSTLVATRIDPADVDHEGQIPFTVLKHHLGNVFTTLDVDGSGQLDTDEFKGALMSLDPSGRELDLSIISAIDEDNSGMIDYNEFVSFMTRYFDNSVLLQHIDKSPNQPKQPTYMESAQMLDDEELEEKTDHAEKKAKSKKIIVLTDDENLSSTNEEENNRILNDLNDIFDLLSEDEEDGDDGDDGDDESREKNTKNRIELSTLSISRNESPVGALTLVELHMRELEDLKTLEEALGIATVAEQSKKQNSQQQLNNAKSANTITKASRNRMSSSSDLAATRLQAHYRGHSTRRVSLSSSNKKRQQREEGKQEEERAALSLQAHTRGHLIRMEAKSEKRERKRERKRAAISLQANFRGHHSRVQTVQRKRQTRIVEQNITSLQAQYRGFRSRKQAKEINRRRATTQQNRAATNVQSCIRGRQSRQQKENMQILREKREANATALQARTRGFLARKQTEKKREASIVLQARFRGHNARIHPPPRFSQSDSNPTSMQRTMQQQGERSRSYQSSMQQPMSPVTGVSIANKNITKSSRKKKKKKQQNERPVVSPLRSNNPILTPAGSIITSFVAESDNLEDLSSSPPRTTSSLQRSLIGGLGLHTHARNGNRSNNRNGMLMSNEMPVDWGDVRLTKHLYSETESLDALYRPLAMPRLLKPAFEDVVHRIRVLWNQLRYPVAQRGTVAKKMMVPKKENYILLVSHMLLLQAAHRHLVHIVNTIRKDLGEDPVGVGTGSHLTPRRPKFPSPTGGSASPRRKGSRKLRRKRTGSGKQRSRRDYRSGGNASLRFSSSRRRNNQWAMELSQAISQLKGVAPWVQEFMYRGEIFS